MKKLILIPIVMITLNINNPTNFNINTAISGETIEMKVRRIVENKEPIKDGAPEIFTPRSEGVRASTNIRTDRFEIAVEATDKIAKSYKARREDKAQNLDKKAPSLEGTQEPNTEDIK